MRILTIGLYALFMCMNVYFGVSLYGYFLCLIVLYTMSQKATRSSLATLTDVGRFRIIFFRC